MNYAIVIGGIVVNVAVADYPVEENWISVDGLDVRIGDTYDGEAFYRDGEKLYTEVEILQIQNADMKAALELLGVSVDG